MRSPPPETPRSPPPESHPSATATMATPCLVATPASSVSSSPSSRAVGGRSPPARVVGTGPVAGRRTKSSLAVARLGHRLFDHRQISPQRHGPLERRLTPVGNILRGVTDGGKDAAAGNTTAGSTAT